MGIGKGNNNTRGAGVSPAFWAGLGKCTGIQARVVAGALTLAGAAAMWGGNHFGLWWVTALVGVALGLLLRGGRVALAAVDAALLGWGLDLLWQSSQADLGGVAGVVALIAGLPRSYGPALIVVALVYGALLALAGAWAGAALRRAVAALARGRTTAPVEVGVAVAADELPVE